MSKRTDNRGNAGAIEGGEVGEAALWGDAAGTGRLEKARLGFHLKSSGKALEDFQQNEVIHVWYMF